MTNPLNWLLVIIVWGAISFGAVYPWGYGSLGAAMVALGVWAWLRIGRHREGQPAGLHIALAAIAVVLLVQVIPLPLKVFKAFSPAGDGFLQQFDLSYSFAPPAWHPLSVSPAETWIALGFFLAVAIFLVGTIDLVARIALGEFIVRLAIVAVVIAVVGLIDRLGMVVNDPHPKLYGFFSIPQGGSPYPPFVNPNHFASWALMVIALTSGYLSGLVSASWRDQGGRLNDWLAWLTRPEAGRLWLLALSVVALVVAVILTNSRSGVAALALVVLIFGVRVVLATPGGAAKFGAVTALIVLLASGLALAGTSNIFNKFSKVGTDTSAAGRIGIWRDTLHVFEASPVFGAGAGSFGQMMLIYQSGDRKVYFTQAHNDYLQILSDTGVLGAAAMLAFIVVIVLATRRRSKRDTDPFTNWIRFGAIAGILGIAAQSMVEFSLQMPGVTVLFAFLLAIAVHRPSSMGTHAHRM